MTHAGHVDHEVHPDPLYDPVWPIFIYSGWAFSDLVISAATGLAVLIGGTALLTAVSLVGDHEPSPRPFLAEFGTILLFCAASLGLGVAVLRSI